MILFYFTWQAPFAQPTEPVLVLQINPAHAVAGAVLAKQLSVLLQHPTTVAVDGAPVYAGVHGEAHE